MTASNAKTDAAFSWKDAPDLMAALVMAQNHPVNCDQDIMTFAGMCSSREQLEAHLGYYEIRAQNFDDVAERRAARRAA